jgi:phosphoglycerate dehydrogenase-like enzyme
MRLQVSVPTDELAAALGDLADAAVVTVWDLSGAPPAAAFDLVVPPYMSPPGLLAALEGVKVGVVQSQSIGYDGVGEVLQGRAVFCNAAGVHEASTAELAVGLVIASLRGFPAFARAQATGEWLHRKYDALADKTVLVLGHGGVGRAIVERLRPFEADVVPIASLARETSTGPVHGIDELPVLLPNADVVVLALPLSDSTRGLVDAAFLAAMRPGALLVNLARGPVVDTAALTDAVLAGTVRAALDVTDPEPLPPDHPLWRHDAVLITPHVGGHSTAMLPRVVRLVRAQVRRLTAGEPLHNVVLERSPTS